MICLSNAAAGLSDVWWLRVGRLGVPQLQDPEGVLCLHLPRCHAAEMSVPQVFGGPSSPPSLCE